MHIIQKTDLFENWLSSLNDFRAKAKILARLKRAELGNLGNWEFIGEGVSEMKIDYGPGYRLYFTRSKGVILILLCGGDKSSQSRDIRKAKQIILELGA